MLKRYSTPEMENLWSEQEKFASFLEVELASLDALAELGIIPSLDAIKIRKNAHFDVEEIKRLEEETKHDVIAFTRCVTSSLQGEKKWFHYGLTSTDVVDSSYAILVRKANLHIGASFSLFLEELKAKAKKYQNTPCMGRTHGMHAEITSFGLKWALYYEEGLRIYHEFLEARQNIEVIKMSGAVGSFSILPLEVEVLAAKSLNLGYARLSTQVLSRDRHASYLFVLAKMASLIEKIATEVRHLSRNEVREVSEYFEAGQKGSSAMPHKQNPIASENMCGLSRIVRSYVSVALENNNLWHERDISHSSTERIMLQDATTLIHYMLRRYTKVINKLVVYEEQMKKNIALTHNVIFSSRVLSFLIQKGYSREQAYDLIQPLTFEAFENQIDFRSLVRSNLDCFTEDELNDCFDMKHYLRNIPNIYERVGI